MNSTFDNKMIGLGLPKKKRVRKVSSTDPKQYYQLNRNNNKVSKVNNLES